MRQQETQWRSVWERSDLHNSLAAITSRCSTVTSLHLCFHSCETADTCCFHISAVLFPQFHTGYFHSCKTGDACYFIPNLAPASHSVKQGPPTFTNETSKLCPFWLVVAPISSTQKTVSKSIRPDVVIDHSCFSIIVLKLRVLVKWDTLLDAQYVSHKLTCLVMQKGI